MNRSGLFPIFAFPVILAIGVVLIPVNPDYGDHALAVKALEQTGRWFAGHLTAAFAFGLAIWAVREILSVLPKAPWYTMIFTTTGAGLYAAGLGADGIGPVAVRSAGESTVIFFDGSGWWVSGVFLTGTLCFAVGLFIITGNTIQAQIIVGVWRYVVFISALVFVSVPAIPSGWGLYGVAAAGFGIFIPIGVSLRRKI